MACCGKIVCSGCYHANDLQSNDRPTVLFVELSTLMTKSTVEYLKSGRMLMMPIQYSSFARCILMGMNWVNFSV